MTNLRQETVDTYNSSARALADYFRGIGSRKKYIDKAFELAGNPTDPIVLEIGCGDGRDANEILKLTKNYRGFDISKEFINLAKERVPEGEFDVGDAVTYNYPKSLDIVFAFASLLHLNKTEIETVMKSVHKTLSANGILYISLKYAPTYKEVIKEDKYGRRQFFLYNPKLIQKLASTMYEPIYVLRETIGHTDWLEIALKKL